VTEDAQEVVAELERLPEREADRAQRCFELVEPTGQRRAEMQRSLDGVLPGLVPLDALRLHGIAAGAGGADKVEVLPDAQLDTQLVEDTTRRRRGVGEEHVGVHEREVADEDRGAFTEPARLAPPRGSVMAVDETAMDRRDTSA